MADVTLSGPLFDRPASISVRGCEAIRSQVAAEGARMATVALTGSIRHEHTGRAVRGVTVITESRVFQTGDYDMPVLCGPDESVITSDLATYGPWLEGTGSRNETTRFKGYHSFRMATQLLAAAAGELADTAFQPYLRELQ